MARLAIKGHPTRGKEVIEILEMLGGINTYKINCTEKNLLYCLREGDNVIIATGLNSSITHVFTLERFLEKFPYKVGDKVQHKGATSCVSIYEVEKMRWEEDTVKYTVHLFGCNYKSSTLPSEYLQPYKEETMEKEISSVIIDIFICLEGFEFYDDKGNIINTKEITMKKKKPQYPKTYVECCEVLGINELPYMVYTWNRHEDVESVLLESQFTLSQLLENLRRIITCRDAYWKMAGDWKPVHQSGKDTTFYAIHRFNNEIIKGQTSHRHSLLEFPTEEMRDSFHENFKELIESCKELL